MKARLSPSGNATVVFMKCHDKRDSTWRTITKFVGQLGRCEPSSPVSCHGPCLLGFVNYGCLSTVENFHKKLENSVNYDQITQKKCLWNTPLDVPVRKILICPESFSSPSHWHLDIFQCIIKFNVGHLWIPINIQKNHVMSHGMNANLKVINNFNL